MSTHSELKSVSYKQEVDLMRIPQGELLNIVRTVKEPHYIAEIIIVYAPQYANHSHHCVTKERIEACGYTTVYEIQ